MVARSALALIAVQRNDAEAAERHYRAIEPQKGTACFIIPLTFDRLLALLAGTFGLTDAALAHYEDGLAFCDRAGYRPEYAWTACDYAKALLARGGPVERDKAVALQDAAVAAARARDAPRNGAHPQHDDMTITHTRERYGLEHPRTPTEEPAT